MTDNIATLEGFTQEIEAARETNRSKPHSVAMSRGYTLRVEFMRNSPIRVRWHDDDSITVEA